MFEVRWYWVDPAAVVWQKDCCWENNSFQRAPHWQAGIGGPTVLYSVDCDYTRAFAARFWIFWIVFFSRILNRHKTHAARISERTVILSRTWSITVLFCCYAVRNWHVSNMHPVYEDSCEGKHRFKQLWHMNWSVVVGHLASCSESKRHWLKPHDCTLRHKNETAINKQYRNTLKKNPFNGLFLLTLLIFELCYAEETIAQRLAQMSGKNGVLKPSLTQLCLLF